MGRPERPLQHQWVIGWQGSINAVDFGYFYASCWAMRGKIDGKHLASRIFRCLEAR